MDWYWIVLIIVGGIVLLGALLFFIYYLSSLKSKMKQDNKIKDFHNKIIEAMGGINNIKDVNVMSSRLVLYLEDNGFINQEVLQELIDNGIGVVKTSKKVTLVIGDLSEKYAKAIIEEKKAHFK